MSKNWEMLNQSRHDYEQRMRKFFEFPLREVMDNNPVCHRIAEEYARGNIVHYDEALAQMVVVMHRLTDDVKRQNIDLLQRTAIATMTVPQL